MRDLIIAGVVAVVAFGSAWKTQDWRYGDQINQIKAEAAEANEKALKKAADQTAEMQRKKDEAINEANQRAQELAQQVEQNQAAADRASHSADSLRQQLAKARSSLPKATCEAARNYAAAVSDVFTDCTEKYRASAERYRELAIQAQGHLSDSMTLNNAWPSP